MSADLPDVFQGIRYLLLLNIIEFHLQAATGKQHSPALPDDSTEGQKIKKGFQLITTQVAIPEPE